MKIKNLLNKFLDNPLASFTFTIFIYCILLLFLSTSLPKEGCGIKYKVDGKEHSIEIPNK